MLNSKQRSNLRSIASTLEPVFQLGKVSVGEDDGIFSETFLKAVDEALEARELIKITVLNNSEEEAKWVAGDLAEALNAEVVCTIGHKVVLYRKSNKKSCWR